MNGISVITIVKNRQTALKNLITGLLKNNLLPAELIIVYMNEEAYELEPVPFSVKSIICKCNIDIPLAAARNKGVLAANCEKIIFLDVDCIPSANLLSVYQNSWEETCLLSGQIRYLSAQAMQQPALFYNLENYSIPDPVRFNINPLPYELFWSLNFGCSKAVFNSIGGFDEGFEGYGAEDTDFAFKARKNHIPIKCVNATAYHQYHTSYSPPLNHLADIVSNTKRFYTKWNIWPMEGWLKIFKEMGLINWDETSISLLRLPTEQELAERLKA